MFECPPMVFYCILVVIQVAVGIYSGHYSKKNYNNNMELEILTIVAHLACWALCAFILHLLCSSGNTGVAWVVVLLPLILGLISGVELYRSAMNKHSTHPAVHN